MIKIVGKFTRKNEIVAWKVDEDGVEYNFGCRAPYHKFFFDSMLESGYVYHDYDGNITDATGMSIKDVIEVSDYLSESDLIDMYDMLETGMMDERDIAQHFKRDIKVELVELREPISTTIKTREDFLARLDSISRAKREGITFFSPHPINAISNREALFTLEEIVSNKDDAKIKFMRMFEENVMTSLRNIKDLCNAYGTSMDAIDQIKILSNYLSWGVPGINADVVNVSINVDPVSPVENPRSGVFDDQLKYAVKDVYGNMYSEDVCGVNIMDLVGGDKVDTTAVFGSTSADLIKHDDIGGKYKIVAYGYRDVVPQVTITLLSKDGITAYFYADCNGARLFQGDRSITPVLPIFRFKTIDNVIIPFSRLANNGVQYIADSVLIRSFIKKEVKNATTEPPYKTSFELMSKNGISPYFAPMFMNRRIKDGDSTYMEVLDGINFTNLHFLCSRTVRNGLSSFILEKYGPDDEEFAEKSIVEQMEYINEEIEELSMNGNYLVEPLLPEGTLRIANEAYSNWRSEYEANEVNNVNFVLACMDGSQNIGGFADGLKIDASSNSYKIFGIIMGLYLAKKTSDPSASLPQFLNSDIENVVELPNLFKKRASAYHGAAKDLAIYRSTMGIQSKKLVYVTKAFRENGNSTIEEACRHYGFEAYVIDKSNGSSGNIIYKSLLEQVIDDMFRRCMKDEVIYAGEIATKMMFAAIFDKDRRPEVDGVHTLNHTSKINGLIYSVDAKLSTKYYSMLRNDSLISVKYGTCYDFCNYQFSEADMNCEYYCVNANITPWNITPRAEFSITDYNLFINYYTMDELKGALPNVMLERLNNTGGKVIDSLRDKFSSSNLFSFMDSYMSIKEQAELAKSNVFLDEAENEDIDAYIIRTTNEIATAKAAGVTVVNTILKSDIQFEVFKPYVVEYDNVGTEPTTLAEFDKPSCNRYISVMAPRVLGRKWTSNLTIEAPKEDINTKAAKFSRVSFDQIPFEAKLWNTKLLTAEFDVNTVVYISKGLINVGVNSYPLSSVNEEFMIRLVERGLAIQISSHKYIVKTVLGFVEVEV